MEHPFSDGCCDELSGLAIGKCRGVAQSFRPIMPPSTPPATPAPAALS